MVNKHREPVLSWARIPRNVTVRQVRAVTGLLAKTPIPTWSSGNGDRSKWPWLHTHTHTHTHLLASICLGRTQNANPRSAGGEKKDIA